MLCNRDRIYSPHVYLVAGPIIIIIIKNVKIRVTLSWVTLQGHFTELLESKKKWSAAGEWGQCHASVSSKSHVFKRLQKERSDGASLTAGGRLFQARWSGTLSWTILRSPTWLFEDIFFVIRDTDAFSALEVLLLCSLQIDSVLT